MPHCTIEFIEPRSFYGAGKDAEAGNDVAWVFKSKFGSIISKGNMLSLTFSRSRAHSHDLIVLVIEPAEQGPHLFDQTENGSA